MSKSEKKKKKIKIPKSVLQLEWSPKKFAKKNNIRISGKGMQKKEKKRAVKRLNREYGDFAIVNLNKAVKILSENSRDDSSKKIEKVKSAVETIISNDNAMKNIAKLYKKNPDQYENLIYLPYMITNTILYFSREDLSEDEKEIAEKLDKAGLIGFCEKILKKQTKVYRNKGLSKEVSFQLANVIPTAKILKGNNQWYKRLIQTLYNIAEFDDVDVKQIFNAILKVDKKKVISKKEFYDNFFGEFIFTKASNKVHNYNDKQKELHETLIEMTTEYLNGKKFKELKEILKRYIKRRKTAESYKNDNKRIIKFIDFANSNSEYANLKSVIQELIEDNSTNELYLG